MMLPKLVITDIDGVWTDGGMYYDEKGNEWKKFNTSDSAGVLFLRLLNIPMAIMTGENSEAVRNRAKKLHIDRVYTSVSNKLKLAREVCADLNIDLKEVAFIGDDINDILLLDKVGFSGAPAQAPEYVKEKVDWVGQKTGGQGAFREFVEHLLHKSDQMDKALEKYFEQINS